MAEEEDPLFREIDEELKQERLFKVWKNYGSYIIASGLAIIIGVASFKGWESYSLKQRMQNGQSFAAAQDLASGQNSKEALAQLEQLIQESGHGYAMLARFQSASIIGNEGRSYEAVDIYTSLADDEDVDQIFRDLAVVLGALQELNTTKKRSKLIERALKLAQGDGIWRHNAREIEAIKKLTSGEKAAASSIFKELANTAGVPQGIQLRAQEILETTFEVEGPA
ncbi:MAG: hypothetical protein CMF69_06915 [Magnetovibrio sp.]|nr:hypothetical protein [Magnetovibrio sp.]